MEYRIALAEISELFGTMFSFKGFCIKLRTGEEYTIEDAKELNITCGEHGITMTGVISDIDFSWHMYIHDFMYKVWMELTSVNNLNVKRVDAMIVEVQAEENYRVVHNGGLFAVNCDLSEITEEINAGSGCAYLSGIYSSEPNATGVSLITYVPMKFRSDYHITNSDVRVKTVFSTDVPSSYESKSVKSESTCVFCNMPLTTAVDEFWKYCYKPSGYEFEKPIGWSSWDYYYTSVTMEDMIENMDEIENDEILCDRIEYIAVDDGWEHREGDWYACYRFPDGIENLAKEVKARGYKPGIWTAPNNLQVLCGTVQRNNSFLIRDEIGDPIKIGDMYILDPTHPDGIEFLRELYTRLRGYGFEFFKVDFVQYLLRCDSFFDKEAGPFDAMRQIFTTIRECVGNGCHIMGCGAHIGIGTGYVDSRRTGIDIHNYWSHICMCTKSFGVQYACNRKVYQNDVDYLIVRGYGTSKESYPNVLNPAWNALKDSKSISWCAGNIFNLNEAKTWCALVLAAGSSIFLGDRLSMLNDSGRDLVRRVVKHADFETAVPSDLISADAYTEWRAPQSGRIYVINWTEKEKAISVEADGSYIDIMTDKIYNSNEGKIEIFLESHEGVALKKA